MKCGILESVPAFRTSRNSVTLRSQNTVTNFQVIRNPSEQHADFELPQAASLPKAPVLEKCPSLSESFLKMVEVELGINPYVSTVSGV